MIELVGPDRRQQAKEGEHQRPHQAEPQGDQWMGEADMDAGPQHHRQPYRPADQEGAGDCSANQAADQFAGRQRRHQIIDDIALHLADQQRETGVGEGILHHRHDDQARRDEIGERDSQHGTAAAPQRDGENDEIEQGRNARRPHRLHLHLEEAAHLLDIEGLQAAPVHADKHRFARRALGPWLRLMALVVHRPSAYRLQPSPARRGGRTIGVRILCPGPTSASTG